jgi:hypothetical protein
LQYQFFVIRTRPKNVSQIARIVRNLIGKTPYLSGKRLPLMQSTIAIISQLEIRLILDLLLPNNRYQFGDGKFPVRIHVFVIRLAGLRAKPDANHANTHPM